ncbi:reverse transcriptase domain-containing protein [Priestia megaterium]|uniref:reverse transcriptase domain-containing protein n=1 Tax=Priestia megaterium TaxID=1404 RepID=UPI002E9AAC18|nr:reverse transcriptase domain-containing protein [Priestia megaterium]
MRTKIINEIIELYNIEESSLLKLLKKCSTIKPYNKIIVKGRSIINKASISLEEQIILDYYKCLVNSYGKIEFPNRSYIMTELINIMPYLHLYKSYTIYKFDFKSFFHHIEPKKSFKALCNIEGLRQEEINFFKKYTSGLSEFMPGIGLHNSLIEISGQMFDAQVKAAFRSKGLLYYARYVDDCILILDERVEESLVKKYIYTAMKECFGKDLKLNDAKTDYYNSDDSSYTIDYLGYAFYKGQSSSSQYKFGISEDKLKKCKEKINSYILEYKDNKDINLLSFKLEVFFKRIVYYGERKGDGKYRWQVRGISDSYKEIKRFMNSEDSDKIMPNTKKLFSKYIEDCFKKNRVEIPPKVNNQLKNHKFISSFINNKALLLHRRIGLSPIELKERLKLVHKGNLENLNYTELARLLIISLY